MTANTPIFSAGFQRLYCDAGVFACFSAFHPISFARVLPFPSQQVADHASLITAEEAHLADRSESTRRQVVEAYARYGLLTAAEADQVKSVIDFYGDDFFELMGMIYANAGMFICALRWYHQFIRELEAPRSTAHQTLEDEGVHASVGYCLYSLGLFEEAIAWSKSCAGPEVLTDAVCGALVGYEAQLAGGSLLATERAAGRTRYTVSAPLDAIQAKEATARLNTALTAYAPTRAFYFDWVSPETPEPAIGAEDYPFRVERDAGNLSRHKMILLFATCGWADLLVERGQPDEAKRLLLEVAPLEPEASLVWDRINALS